MGYRYAAPMIPALILIFPTFAAADVTVSWAETPRSVYVGEAFPLTLRVAVPTGLVEDGLLQLFPQELGLPVQVTAFGNLPDGRFSEIITEPDRDLRTRSMVLDGEVVRALDLGPGAANTTEFHVSRWFVLNRPGELVLPAPAIQYATATAFEEDLVQGRIPVDRTAKGAQGSTAALSVIGVPETEESLDFRGAVGSFELSSSVDRARAAVGETIRLRVLVASTNGSPVPELRPDAIQLGDPAQFHETGRTVERAADGWAVEISLSPKAPLLGAAPGASLMAFNPDATPPAYYTAAAAGPNVQVQRAPAPADDEPRAADASPEQDRPIPYWTYGMLAFVFALAVASVIRRQMYARSQPEQAHAPRS